MWQVRGDGCKAAPTLLLSLKHLHGPCNISPSGYIVRKRELSYFPQPDSELTQKQGRAATIQARELVDEVVCS